MIEVEVNVKWEGPRAARNMLSALLHGIHDGAEYLAQEMRENIGTQGPPASAPGEFPHRDTGDLQDSIRVVENRREKSFRVIADAEHAAPVEATRPFIRRTYLENKSKLRRIVLDRARASYGHFRLG